MSKTTKIKDFCQLGISHRKTKKRGVLAIIAVILLFSIILNANSQQDTTGCCTKPEFPFTCEEMTVFECCGTDDILDDCVNNHFNSGINCNDITSLCGSLGCCYTGCIGERIGADGIPNFEGFSNVKQAYCENRNQWDSREGPDCSQHPECQLACCICLTDTYY